MTKVVYLPLDERPCNAKYPLQLAAMADLNVVAPPAERLGNKKRPAQYDRIADWLLGEVNDADYLLVSIDMLVYGGIVPSRLHHLSESVCLDRLHLLRQIKAARPSIKICAFNLIMRVPAYNSSEEEPAYYAEYGAAIYRYGWLQDKAETEPLEPAEQAEWDSLQNSLPAAVLEDFLARRRVNRSINQQAIALVRDGVLERLAIPLDDNARYGFSPMEQRKLLFQVEEDNLMDRVLIYPGADEIGCTLLAYVFCAIKQYQPEVYIRYSSTQGPFIIPRYEDRSLNESIKSHLTAAGAYIGDSSATADIALLVNSPPVSQQLMAESPDPYRHRHRSYFSEVHLLEFATAIEALANKGAFIAIADVASGNGGDHSLLQLLAKKGLLPRIAAYAGWNTSGNAIGTAVAHAVIASYYRQTDNAAAHWASRQFYRYRLIEDWGYQTIVRTEVYNNRIGAMGGSYFDLDGIQQEVEQLVATELQAFCRTYLDCLMDEEEIASLQASLPWNRLFEVNLEFGTTA